MTSLRYAAVTPARNEARNLRRLARCLRAQTVPPDLWVIVDNGSSDDTRAVAEQLAAETAWIRVTDAPPAAAELRGAPVVRAFEHGRALVSTAPDVVVKLDADVSFPRRHFELLLEAFEADPSLGIASGVCFERSPERGWSPRGISAGNAWGAVRAYRRECLRDVTPLAGAMGWDGIDVLRAAMNGWQTRTVEGLVFRHHRREGERDGSRYRAWSAQGRASWYMGYRSWFLVARALGHARREPAAVAMIVGFASAALRAEPRYEDRSVRNFLRAQQRFSTLMRLARTDVP